jgi:hypothetical protein
VLLLAAGFGVWTSPALPAGNDECFAPSTSANTGPSPTSIAVGDFNGDGRLDLAVANSGLSSNTVSVLLGMPGTLGSFQAPVSYVVGQNPVAIAVGDFNGDGHLDLAVANFNSNNVTVLAGLPNAPGTFQLWATYPVGTNPVAIAAADFNGDGQLDLAVANIHSNNVSVLLNSPSTPGAFQPAVNYNVGTSPTALAVADFNGDGRPDLAVANAGSNNVTVLAGNSNAPGTFVTSAVYPVGTNPYSIAVGDFNGDGRLDLAVANFSSNDVSVLLGSASPVGTFQAPVSYGAGAGPVAVAVGDFNGDGRLDLAVADLTSNTVSVLLGNTSPAGTFQAAVTYAAGTDPTALVAADFNGDGQLDLAATDEGAAVVSLLLGSPTAPGTFQLAVNYQAGTGPASMTEGDFNGDGWLDLVVANNGASTNTVSILFANPSVPGTFQPPVSLPTSPTPGGTNPFWVITADLNRDGHLDLVVANDKTNEVAVLLADPHTPGTFLSAVTYPVGNGPTSVAVADLDGDGRLDLVVANFGNSQSPGSTISVLLADPNGPPATFLPAVPYTVGTAPAALAVGDFNGDGRPDVAVANFGLFASPGNMVSVLLGDPNQPGKLQNAANYTAGTGPVMIAVADLNGDGRLDLAVANVISANVSVLLGSPTTPGTFQTAVSYPTGSAPHWIAVADLNGDGRLDLATADSSVAASDVSVLFANTASPGTFQPPVNYAVGTGPQSVVVGDFNHDGRLDLAATNSRQTTVSVLLNANCVDRRATAVAQTQTAVAQTATAFALTQAAAGGTATAVARTATALALTATAPTATPTATRTPTATASATPTGTRTTVQPGATPYPQPNVAVETSPDMAGRLRVTVTGRDAGCTPNNTLTALRFGSMTNARVDLGDGALHAGSFDDTLPTPGPRATFYVVRQTPGQASTVSLTVVDGCGAWPTFVGGGPTAF